MTTVSRLHRSNGVNVRRRRELLLKGVRLAEGAELSMPSSRLGFAGARWGMSATPWSGGAPEKGGSRRGVALKAASSVGGASGKSGAGYGFSLVWPLGGKFAAAMLMQSCGPVCVPVGGVSPWWRQPPCQRSGGVLCINHSRTAMCMVSICTRVMN